MAACSSLPGPGPGQRVSPDPHPTAPRQGSTEMLCSTAHPTAPPMAIPQEVWVRGSSKLPTCTCSCLLLSSKVSSALDQSQSFLILNRRIGSCHPCRLSPGSLSLPSPSQLGTLPGPQLHSQEGQGGHADHGHEQPGQDGEGQEVGESYGKRGDRADPCRCQQSRGGRLTHFCVSPQAGWCPVPCRHPGTGRAGGVTQHSDKQQHRVLPFAEPKPIPPHFFDRSAALNSIFRFCGLFQPFHKTRPGMLQEKTPLKGNAPFSQ